jgi:hypothetical protein
MLNRAKTDLVRWNLASCPISQDFERESAPVPLEARSVEVEDDDVEIINVDHPGDAFAVYFADANGGGGLAERPPVFSETLGLAIEELHDGTSIERLWEVP